MRGYLCGVGCTFHCSLHPYPPFYLLCPCRTNSMNLSGPCMLLPWLRLLLWDLALALISISQLLPTLIDPVPASPSQKLSLRSLSTFFLSSNSTSSISAF